MNYQFVRCRTSPLSKLGRLGAIFLYPTAGILFLLSSLVLIGSLFYTKDITFIQMSVILVLVSGTISLSFYLFKLSKMCYALESREIAFDQSGLTVRDRTEAEISMRVKSAFSWKLLTRGILRGCLRAIYLVQPTLKNMF